MTDLGALSPTYAQARASFLHAATGAHARLTEYLHPRSGLEDEILAIDVAELGPADATKVLLIVSGTHGVEGYCGSALQSEWLRTRTTDRPADLLVIFVHALNPFGFSWVRRTNEDNVDLNRNFIDWSTDRPQNPDYEEIADLLIPETWNEAELERTNVALFALLETMSLEELQQVISGGQFTRPDGVFYGGEAPAWSNTWLRTWASDRLASATDVAIVDLHTGLGPWGHGELISSESRGTDAFRRSTQWWGEVTSMIDGGGVSAQLVGDWLEAAPELIPSAEVTGVALEYGVVDSITVVQALRADAWLHAHGDPTAPGAGEVRSLVRAAFADDDPAWIAAVRTRFDQVVDQAIAGLIG